MKNRKDFFMLRVFPCLVILTVFLLMNLFQIPCVFKTLLGVPCPGCGMSHAVIAAAHLDLRTAFSEHAMFWSMPLVFLLILTNGRLFRRKWLDLALLMGIGVGFLANYIRYLILFFF